MSRPATPTNKTLRPGFVLVAVATIMTALFFLGSYFLEQSTGEIRISKSENAATKAYYLAEAGANEAVYKLKNDATWKSKFLAGTLAGDTASRNQVFDANGSYTIAATSVGSALADITVTATYTIGTQQAKRIIKSRFARADNPADVWTQSLYGGGQGGQQNGNITTNRNCTINGGKIHANQNFKVTSQSTLTVNDAEVASSNNIVVNAGSTLTLNNSTQTEGQPVIGMPQVDFDSASGTSLKNRASQTYTAADFAALPSGTTLNGITYITGDAVWTNKNITINGIIASSGDIKITLNSGKTFTVNSNAPTGSGIMAKDEIAISLDMATLTLNGLVYAANELDVDVATTDNDANLIVTGGVIGWHVDIDGYDKGACSLTFDQDLAWAPLDPVLNGTESPIIEVNHWEEQY